MSTDQVEEQLHRYGGFLRSEMDAAEHPVVSLQSNAERSERDRRPRPARLLRVAAALVPLVALTVGLLALRRDADELIAVPVEAADQIDLRPLDTDAFTLALDNVDFEVQVNGPLAPTDDDRATIVDVFNRRHGGVIADSVTIVQELESGPVVVEFDVVPAPTDDLGNGIVTDRCQVIGQRVDDTELEFPNNGYACFDPDYDQFQDDDRQFTFSYGCQPALPIPGGQLFGKRDFTATVDLVPDSPGVIFTLANGDDVLVRPTQDLVVYAGPPADQMTIYTADGAADVIDTSDCL